MGYFEDKLGVEGGDYSPPFLEIDAEAGPWLTAAQERSPVDPVRHPRWQLDVEQGVIWFGDEQTNAFVATIQFVGTHDTSDGSWLWAWSNPRLQPVAEAVDRVREAHEDIPELTTPTFTCTAAKAWAVAAAAAYELEAQGCLRLPEGEIHSFVALMEIEPIGADDPRARVARQDPERAREALAEYAGPVALHLGVALMEQLRSSSPDLDAVLAELHRVCDNLEELSRSPVGAGTEAAEEALMIAHTLRQAVPLLSVPTITEETLEGIQELFALLRDIARQYGAWPEEPGQGDE